MTLADGATETLPLEGFDPHEDQGDDLTIYTFGHAASAADRQAITAVVKRYYAAAAASDGVTACSLLFPTVAKAVPKEWGGPGPGPPYLRGKRTCDAIMSKMFAHFHDQMVGPTEVTGVRVKGNRARADLRSSTLPFLFTQLEREHGVWRITELLGAQTP